MPRTPDTILQTADHVLIMVEMVHDARIIRIGDGPRLPDFVRPWMGNSWGRWEGDVLVVETTNLHPLRRFRGNSSDHLRVIDYSLSGILSGARYQERLDAQNPTELR